MQDHDLYIDLQQTHKAFEEASTLKRTLRDILGPGIDMQGLRSLAELNNYGINGLAKELSLAAQIKNPLKDFQNVLDESRFRVPTVSEAFGLLSEFKTSSFANLLPRDADFLGLKEVIGQMRSPWLDAEKAMESVSGLAKLQSVADGLRIMPPFGKPFEVRLRESLGDWRDPITWPPNIFSDFHARFALYEERGFDTTLTNFPAPAFEESLRLTDLYREPPSSISRYAPPVPAIDVEERDFKRTNEGHDHLQRFETHIRQFMDQIFTAEYGPGWEKHRLPNNMHDNWHAKKKKDLEDGAKDWPLVCYADFTDYVLVITKRDNWPLFARFFKRMDSVRESFQRLYPIRLSTMHARVISESDALYLTVETRRLLSSIKGHK